MNTHEINHSKAYIREQWRKYGKLALHSNAFTSHIARLRNCGYATRTFASGKVTFPVIELTPDQVQFVRDVFRAGLATSIAEVAAMVFNDNTEQIEQWKAQLMETAQ